MKTATHTFDYQQFINFVQDLVAQGKTSGPQQTEELANFTSLNLKRMERIFKTTQIHSELKEKISLLAEPQQWMVITEAWCGDSAQILPALAKIADVSAEKINLIVVLRDENLHLMEKYHTNGSHAIPKLVAFDAEGKEIFNWGPRPAKAQEITLDWKKDPRGRTWEDYETELHTWYAKDKTNAIQQEILEKLENLGADRPDISLN